MNPRPEDIDALAKAIDRVVFADSGAAGPEVPSASLALVSHLNDSFPRMTIASARRGRVQRRVMRALGIPASPSPAGWVRLESEMNRRLGNLDPKWTPVVGGAALVLLGVVGFAVWRQRGTVKPATAAVR
ncbi:MAG: hypothetical protein E6I68_10110 [Chloroflexi bacterium]|nr:MAG: hypothetical protein E6I68_10110 [Chloroflexota bacterium]